MSFKQKMTFITENDVFLKQFYINRNFWTIVNNISVSRIFYLSLNLKYIKLVDKQYVLQVITNQQNRGICGQFTCVLFQGAN